MESRILLFLISFISLWKPAFLKAQSVPVRDTLLLSGIKTISLTRQGQVLAADDKSNIFLLDSLGKVAYSFSPRRPARIHLLEGWNGLRIFAFYRDFQEFVLLDRFLLSDGPVPLDPEKTGYARLVAPSLDGNLWVLDESSFQLKKMETASQKTLFSTPLDLVLGKKQYEISFMRECQNQLYLADKQGLVLVFDQMGNFRKKLPLKGVEWFGFLGEDLYATEKDSLSVFHPFRLQKQKRPLPPEMATARQVLLVTPFVYWIGKEGLYRRRDPDFFR